METDALEICFAFQLVDWAELENRDGNNAGKFSVGLDQAKLAAAHEDSTFNACAIQNRPFLL